jgi:metallophosphoesterase (TIGR00282 family)
MKVIFIGDIVGKPGRRFLQKVLPDLRKRLDADFVIANAENSAEGYGIVPGVIEELASSGVDLISVGDHVWDRKEIVAQMDTDHRLVRPANYPPGVPGHGSAVAPAGNGQKVGFLCLQGRVFMQKEMLDDPFRNAKADIEKLKQETPVVIVEIHAEATSEKMALGWHLDGLASAVIGTHTHVQTADERLLPGGTAFISDAGMTGPRDGVIGFDKEIIIGRFMTQVQNHGKVAPGRVQLNGVLLEIDETTGKAVSISRISEEGEVDGK